MGKVNLTSVSGSLSAIRYWTFGVRRWAFSLFPLNFSTKMSGKTVTGSPAQICAVARILSISSLEVDAAVPE